MSKLLRTVQDIVVCLKEAVRKLRVLANVRSDSRVLKRHVNRRTAATRWTYGWVGLHGSLGAYRGEAGQRAIA